MILYLLLFLLAAGLNILLGLHGWPSVFAGSLNDPDSYMRLLRIEQGIKAGHLVVDVARDDSGAGVYVEWSRLLDMLLWLMAAPFALFIGWHKALYVAGVLLGPLGVGALGASLGWAVEPFAARRYLWAAAFMVPWTPGLYTICLPGVVHYHVLLLALIALTAGFAARAWRDDSWAGFLAGVSGGFAIWLTPETMPFVLMAYAALLLRWLKLRNGNVLLAVAAGCFDVIAVGFFVDPPGGGYGTVEIDRLSLVYVAMALALLAGAAFLARMQHRLRRWRGPVGIAVMALPVAAWVAAFPAVALGPYGLMPPDQMHAFFGVMTETQPVRGVQLPMFLLPGLCAVAYALWRAYAATRTDFAAMAAPDMLGPAQRSPWVWLYVALCGAVAVVLGAKFLLFVGFSAAFACALLPVALSQVSAMLAAAPGRAALARIGILVLVLGAPEALALGGPGPQPAAPVAAARVFPSCSLRGVAPLLAPAAGQVVLAQVEDGPELLYRTQVEIVGSLYQHGVPGFLRDRAAWRVVPGAIVPPEMAATKASYVLFCPQAVRYGLVADLPKTSLWDALEAGAPPVWLMPVGTNAAGWVLYKITG